MIAIGATLLVLELKLPESGNFTYDEIVHWLRITIGWVISFAAIAVLWFENHLQLSVVHRCTMKHASATFLQLALLSLIPFASGLIADRPKDFLPAAIFNIVLLVNGLVSVWTTTLIEKHSALREESGGASVLRTRSRFQFWLYSIVGVLGIAGSWFHHPFTGVVLWMIIPVVVWRRFHVSIEGGEHPEHAHPEKKPEAS